MFTSDQCLDLLFKTLLLGPLSLIWIALVVRLIGLRSFSKMTAFDFISTVATGSLLGSAAGSNSWTDFLQNSGAVLAILGIQAVIAFLRKRFPQLLGIIENEPVLLMEEGSFIPKNLVKTRVSEEDVMAKLREANVLELAEVRAVVLETTGDISVLHGDKLDNVLLRGVNLTGRKQGS